MTRTERVKSVDLHPTEPWVLSSLYSGKLVITNHETNSVVKTFDVSDLPVRCACFVVRKQWIMCGSDDMKITVYNYNTLDKVHSFDAHNDYVRCIAVHPSQPLFLTSSDDMTIKLWNFETWKLVRTFEGHSHYTMHVAFNPKDTNLFATASLDNTVKVWNINSSSPSLTLSGHQKGVNYVSFYYGTDKPFLISGSDDGSVKVWDYGTKACIQTLEGHSNNVSVCCFHPKLPIIISGSEDGSVIIWNSSTYKVEETLNYGLERVWTLAITHSDTKLAIGYDEGTVVVKLKKEVPVVSMDDKGKIIYALHNDVQLLSIKGTDTQDGEKVSTTPKDLGTLEIYPFKIQHDPSGRYVSVSGDGEFIIYNAASWRNKQFGEGEEMVWGYASGEYAVKERSGKIKVFKDFKEHKVFKTIFYPDQIFGGHLIGVKSKNVLLFYDWETCELIRSIEVVPKNIYWNEIGDSLILSSENSFFILSYNSKLVSEERGKVSEEGVPDSISLLKEVSEKIRDGAWIGDCFIYTNNQNKLNYYIGGEIVTLAHLDKTCYFLGYVPKNNRVYLMEKDQNVISYQLHLSVLQYQTAIVKGDLDAASKLLEQVPQHFYNQLARFVDAQGHKTLALSLSTDPEHKFELSLELGDLKSAYEIVKKYESDQKWKQLGGIALSSCDFKLAEECLFSGKDYSGLLLLFSSLGDRKGFEKLAEITLKEGKNSISFLCHFLLGKLDICLNLLIETKRYPEAAFFSRTYCPKETSKIVKIWKASLKSNQKVAERLADPIDFPNLFPDFNLTQEAELFLKNEQQNHSSYDYLKYSQKSQRNIIDEIKKGGKEQVLDQPKDEIKQEENVKQEEVKQEEIKEEVKQEEVKEEVIQEEVKKEEPKKKPKKKSD